MAKSDWRWISSRRLSRLRALWLAKAVFEDLLSPNHPNTHSANLFFLL
jgi:hypothetical protein